MQFIHDLKKSWYSCIIKVKEIIHNNKQFTTEDALNLGIIALYAPRDHACEITEEVVNLYLEIVDDLDLECCLYSSITIMIDAFFDDENDYRRLTAMIDKKTSGGSKHISEVHKSTIESLKYAKEDLDLANDKIRDLEAKVKRLTEELNSKQDS